MDRSLFGGDHFNYFIFKERDSYVFICCEVTKFPLKIKLKKRVNLKENNNGVTVQEVYRHSILPAVEK